jgi:hypothetical protein
VTAPEGAARSRAARVATYAAMRVMDSSYPIDWKIGNVSRSQNEITDICPVTKRMPVRTSRAPIAISTLCMWRLKREAHPRKPLANTAAMMNGMPMPSE